MIKSILTFLNGLLQVFFYWRKKADDPANQAKGREDEIDKALANKDGKALTESGSSDLDKLRRLRDRQDHSG